MVNKRYKDILIAIIKKHVPECKIFLFGSRAKGTHQPTSDIDIALHCNNEIEFNVIGKIKEDVEESVIPFFVDIVDINAVSDEMKQQIKNDGILWTI
jgi:uncharacterized protein